MARLSRLPISRSMYVIEAYRTYGDIHMKFMQMTRTLS